MELEATILERARNWETLSQWERSELGKDLRRAGLSYGEIMAMVPVKKSTLATWCRDVELTPDQWTAIRNRTGAQEGVPRDTNRKRKAEIARVRAEALDDLPRLAGDPLWVAGLVMYWAEGAKTRNHVKVANADPRALRLFIKWIRTYLDSTAEFSLQLHLHEGNDEAAAKAYWQQQTGLWSANFYRTFIKPQGTGHRKNHLVHGVCTVKMRRCSDAWNIIMAWIDGSADHFGLDRGIGRIHSGR